MGVTSEDSVKILRIQNHDILNNLQVIAGYLQLGRSQKALSYLNKTVKMIQAQSSIFRWVYPRTVMFLLQLQLDLSETGIKLYIENETDLKEVNLTQEELNKILFLLLQLAADYCLTDKGLLLKVTERNNFYVFEFSSTFIHNNIDSPYSFPTTRSIVENMGCRLEWILDSGSVGRLICNIPKKQF